MWARRPRGKKAAGSPPPDAVHRPLPSTLAEISEEVGRHVERIAALETEIAGIDRVKSATPAAASGRHRRGPSPAEQEEVTARLMRATRKRTSPEQFDTVKLAASKHLSVDEVTALGERLAVVDIAVRADKLSQIEASLQGQFPLSGKLHPHPIELDAAKAMVDRLSGVDHSRQLQKRAALRSQLLEEVLTIDPIDSKREQDRLNQRVFGEAVSALKKSREKLMAKYVQPLVSSKRLTLPEAKASADRLSKVTSSS